MMPTSLISMLAELSGHLQQQCVLSTTMTYFSEVSYHKVHSSTPTGKKTCV